MDWLVTGARGGKPGRWKLEAADESAARRKAAAKGVTVADVQEYPAAHAVGLAAVVAGPSGVVQASQYSEPAPAVETGSPGGEAGVSGSGYPAPDEASDRNSDRNEVSTTDQVAAEPTGQEVEPVVTPLSETARETPPGKPAEPSHPKRKGLGLMLMIGVAVIAIAIGVYAWFHFRNPHQGQDLVVPTAQRLEDDSRADRVARAKIQVQFVGIHPDPANDKKYVLAFTFKCLASGVSVPRLDGRLRISDASGREIETLGVFESFPQGLGTDPVRREGTWTLDPGTAQRLQSDANQLKLEFDPLNN